MKLNHPAKRLTAALLSGAMLFTLSAPALAADPGTAPDTLPSAAAPLNEENGDRSVTFTIGGDANNYTFTTDRDTSFEKAGVSYTHADNTLTFTGTHESLTIDAPGVNVKITGTPDQTLVGKQGEPNPLVLKITNSASVYISNLQDGVTSDKQAIAGKAEIKSDGNVTIYGTDRAVGGAMLTVDAGGDVEIANNHACAAIWKDANITSGGNVTIGSKADGGWAQGTRADNSSLTVKAAGDVTLTGGDNASPVVQNPTIECGGKLTIENTAPNGRAAVGTMKYTNTSAQEMVLRGDGKFYSVVASKKSGGNPSTSGVAKFTAAPEEKIPLTLTNCYATNYTSSDHRNSFYAGETVYVYPERPTNGVSFQKWVYPDTLTLTSNDPAYIGFAMPAEPVDITAVWNYYDAESQELDIKWNSETVKLTPASFTDTPTVDVGNNALNVTYADNVYTVTLNNSSANDSLNITGYTGQDGKQPSVVFVSNDAKLTSLNVKGSKNFTAESSSGKAIDCSGDVIIDCGGDVTISSTIDKAINCAKNVNITSGGNVNITSTGSAIESREASITSGGDVTITSSDGNAAISCYGAAAINCSGNVTVNSSSATAVAVEGNALIIENAQDVTITAQKAIFHGFIDFSAGGADSPAVRITCSGEVTLKSTGAGDTLLEGLHPVIPGSVSQTTALTYNQANSYAYEVWADNALLTDKGEAGTSFTLLEDTTYSSIHIIPDVPAPIIPDDGGEGGDGSGIAGAVVAGVAIGGAAVWGSYEIATRVILNDLLPEGAAIPANRGQLALLVWSTAGRPAPAAVPAFADVADPDTAAAAQWCVEQGYLDAKKDGKFDPNGWTPKFRVIEVWNKAFPKQ